MASVDMAHRKSPAELSTELQDQRAALQSSCEGYDKGNLWEAKRIAACIYMLLYDTDRSRSLLQTLGIKHDIAYISSSKPLRPGNFLNHHPLVGIMSAAAEPMTFVPFCRFTTDGTYKVSFDTWWNEVVYAKSKEGVYEDVLKRKDMVYIMRSQDGGAHIDTKITNELYYEYSQDAGWSYNKTPIINAHLATMRQMAWELLTSLEVYFS